MIRFAMPSLGADMDAGTLVEWYRAPGDALRKGDVIALVETQKGAIEIEVFHDGTLARTLVEPGVKVPVGTVLAEILEPGETAPAAPPPAAAPAETAPASGPAAPAPAGPPAEPVPPVAPAAPLAAAAPSPPPPVARPGSPAEARPMVTPAARRAAEAAGIDPSAIRPGPGGVIGLAEVMDAAGASAPAPARRPGLDLAEMRKAIGAAMSRSHREIPHYWVSRTIDVTGLFAWLSRRNAERPVAERMLYAAPLVGAVARALKESPALNGHLSAEGFRPAEAVHLGIGTALRGGGLVAPALRDADRLDDEAIMAALADLVPRARAGHLRGSELTDGTATLSSLGEDTSDMLMPLIYPPQVAIVGCGGPVERPFPHRGAVALRRVMTVTVGGDHRVSDGRVADRFLARLERLLQEYDAP